MKIERPFSSLFVLALCLGAILRPGFAATTPSPLSDPYGLAVDAAGNLYVANYASASVLVYSSSYVQKSKITAGLNDPTGLAIDPYGNLWVANELAQTVTEYIKGVQNTSATITDGGGDADGLVVDGLDNIWVQRGESDVAIYSPTAAYAPPSKLVQDIAPTNRVRAFAVGAGAFLHSTPAGNLFLDSASAALEGDALNGGAFSFGASALAPDNKGNIYGVIGSQVYIVHPNSTATNLFKLPASATLVLGMAVDNVRGRIYISSFNTNQIFVYSTAGKLIHTFHN